MQSKESRCQTLCRIRNLLVIIGILLLAAAVILGIRAFAPENASGGSPSESQAVPVQSVPAEPAQSAPTGSLPAQSAPAQFAAQADDLSQGLPDVKGSGQGAPGKEVEANPEGQPEQGAPDAESPRQNAPEESTEPAKQAAPPAMAFIICLSLCILDWAAAAVLTFRLRSIRRELTGNGGVHGGEAVKTGSRMEAYPPTQTIEPHRPQKTAGQIEPAKFGKAHNIGKRPAQQDSFGKLETAGGQGILAVVADGMGGLSGGDQVSQRIVMSMLNYGAQLRPGQMDGVLPWMVRQVNEEINQMLGRDGLYKSGSTLVAVLVQDRAFHWLSIGDSRIYLYRNGRMLQLNQEHTLLQDWMPDILNGRLSYEEALQNPDKGKLTSFIGMGRLKHVDASLHPVRLQTGDRILLMSDGVFNTLPETEMEQLLAAYPDVQAAANAFEKEILAADMPGQDNFTVAILGF